MLFCLLCGELYGSQCCRPTRSLSVIGQHVLRVTSANSGDVGLRNTLRGLLFRLRAVGWHKTGLNALHVPYAKPDALVTKEACEKDSSLCS